jgi:hypothetical protein
MGKSAIVTMIIGDRYRQLWQRVCASSWQAYAVRHGFDLCIIDKPLDTSEIAQRRGISWQKLLMSTVPTLHQYEHLIWIDADIVINPGEIPSILNDLRPGQIGAVRYHALLSHPMFSVAYQRLCRGQLPSEFCANIFRNYGLTGDSSQMIQGGVLVVPASLLPFLESIYRRYSTAGHEQYQEQPIVSWELANAGLIQFLDEKFNAVWYEYKQAIGIGDRYPEISRVLARLVLKDVYFLHFAGNQQDMAFLVD